MTRRLMIILAVLALVLSLPAPALAGTSPQGLHNSVFAHTQQRHPIDAQVAFALAQTDHQTVTAQNVARAFSHDCDGCQAVAVAFQVVLASGANNLVLTNTATAVNLECETCTAVAVAEQWVVADTSAPVTLTPAGQAALAAVQQELGTAPDLTEVLSLADEVSTILAADVIDPPGITITHNAQVSP